MIDIEKEAWASFKAVATDFLGNNKSPNYKKIVAKMVKNFQKLGCLMNLKLTSSIHTWIDFLKMLGITAKNKENGSIKILKWWINDIRVDKMQSWWLIFA